MISLSDAFETVADGRKHRPRVGLAFLDDPREHDDNIVGLVDRPVMEFAAA